MKIARIGIAILLSGLFSTAAFAGSQEDWVRYDNFNSQFMDIEKWTASESWDAGVVILESTRGLYGGRLNLMCRAFGNTPPDPPYLGTRRGDVRSFFGIGRVFQSIKVSVKVNDIKVTGCPDNTDPTYSRVSIVGNFFNVVDPNPSPGDSTDDVGAGIRIVRGSDSTDKHNLLEVWGDVWRCTNPGCTSVSFVEPTPVLLGKIKLGQWATIQIDWDRNGRQFNLKADRLPTLTVPYPQEWEEFPANNPVNFLRASNWIANCPPDKRALGFVEAEFDNLYVRELPSP